MGAAPLVCTAGGLGLARIFVTKNAKKFVYNGAVPGTAKMLASLHIMDLPAVDRPAGRRVVLATMDSVDILRSDETLIRIDISGPDSERIRWMLLDCLFDSEPDVFPVSQETTPPQANA